MDFLCQDDEKIELGKPLDVWAIGSDEKTTITPVKVVPLLQKVWDGEKILINQTLNDHKEFLEKDLKTVPPKILDLVEPEVYPVRLSTKIYQILSEEFAKVKKLAE